jgi:hypothetical protein
MRTDALAVGIAGVILGSVLWLTATPALLGSG